MRGREALHEAKTATAVRVRYGRAPVTGGPFAETKEVSRISAANLRRLLRLAGQPTVARLLGARIRGAGDGARLNRPTG